MIPQLNSGDLEFLQLLQRLQPAGIQELVDHAGVTATAIRHRLNRLQENELVSRISIPQERGRPAHQYEVTRKGLQILGDESADLTALLWRELQKLEDESVRNRLLASVKTALVERLGTVSASSSLMTRVQELCSSLEGRGLLVESEVAGKLPVIREHSCPYLAIAQEDSTICDIEREAFSTVLQVPVALSRCRMDGHRCCEFQVGVPT
jgi:predicted ArsR family transcriptional regulator